MLRRYDYLKLIEEIRNTEKKSLDEYIQKVLEPLRYENENFIETLYKDIYYLTKDNDEVGENDLEIEDGDLVIEEGDFKLTSYQSRLQNLAIWLHIEITKKFLEEDFFTFTKRMEEFKMHFLDKPNYTPEYKSELDKVKRSLRTEMRQNSGEQESFWSKLFDLDNLELKPNFSGVGINLNHIINKFREK